MLKNSKKDKLLPLEMEELKSFKVTLDSKLIDGVKFLMKYFFNNF